MTIATYSFLPWLRRGVANAITAAAPGDIRATVAVDLTLTGDGLDGAGPITVPIHRDVQLYGPGDIVGLDQRAIVRTEPRPWITDFEPNYLAHIEFYDEDLPWRYTPAAVDGADRLTPWLTLLVLQEDEFDDGRAAGKPLPFITIDEPAAFPPAADLWAWAHVHVNRSLAPADDIVIDDEAAVLARFDAAMAENPDLGISRLVSPRHLTPDTAYHAFVVPTYESGRLAGLGLAEHLDEVPTATASAWADYAGRAEPTNHPYYHRWYFRTGTAGDFEFLVRLLVPRKVDPRVGQRDMDTRHPLQDVAGIDIPGLGGVLRLGGALRVPEANLDADQLASAQRYEQWDTPFPHPFQTDLAALVNLADDYETGAAADPDPIITPPLYGRWHALTSRLLEAATPPVTGNWVHELNLDPRFRVPAGFGTTIVQDNQEEYVAAAWDQIGDVLAANRKIRFGHLAREVGGSLYRRHLAAQLAASPGRVLELTGPVQRRVLTDGVTVAHRLKTGAFGSAPVSTAMRRITRPRARLARALGIGDRREQGLQRLAVGKATAAPPKRPPTGVMTTHAVRESAGGRLDGIAARLLDGRHDPRLVAELPHLPAFRPVSGPWRDPPQFEPGERDSRAGRAFKDATRGVTELFRASVEAGQEPPRGEIDLAGIAAGTLEHLHPDVTVPRRVLDGLRIPERLRPIVVEQFREVMAYPEIDVPMYRPLVDRSSELFLPNLNLIPQNTVTLLETNQRFIESYMVGLNHEMARELLWREYPTDQQGSYFRQFWDPKGQLSEPGESPEHRRERLRDIPPLHQWTLSSTLGSHDNRELVPGAGEEELVLVIRGDLLKRYPTAVIYAQRAKWRMIGGQIDPAAERELDDLTPAEEAEPPPTKLLTPLYEAKVDPDIYFLGFDLTAAEAKGESPDVPNANPGWFFVIRERPGEPRFGFDLTRDGSINVWNDLTWDDVAPAPSRFAPATPPAPLDLRDPSTDGDPSNDEKQEQYDDDEHVTWTTTARSSELAYILFQAPVLVAVHAEEMLGP